MLTPRQIARELIAPTRKWHVSHVGDSRAVGKNQLIGRYSALAWGGMGPRIQNTSDTTGHVGSSATVTLAGANVNEAIPTETVNDWVLRQYRTAVFNGEAEPAGAAASICSCSMTLASYPLVTARLIANGGGAKVRCVYRKHATGIVGGSGIYLEALQYNGAPFSYCSPTITDSTGTGLVIAEATIPAGFNWAGRADFAMRWAAVAGGTNPDGAIFQWPDLMWIESDGPCLVYHSHGLSGSQWSNWLDDDFAPAARWGTYRDLLGEDQILWSSMGVNSWSLTTAQNVSDLSTVIARFRAANPDGPVVLDTTYPCHYAIGVPSSWREAILQVSAATEGCLLVDAHARRDFEAWYSAGWIGDGIHASDPGVAVWMGDIGALVTAAAGDESAMQHSDTLRDDYCDAAIARIDGGDAAGKLVLRDGATVVATITLDDPCGAVSGGVLTFAGFPKTDLACDNAGTPDNAVITESDDTVVLTLTAGILGTDVLLAKATYAAGEPLKINSASYTAPV